MLHEMRKPLKIRGFINFGETGDEPNTFYFYFQHNNRVGITPNFCAHVNALCPAF